MANNLKEDSKVKSIINSITMVFVLLFGIAGAQALSVPATGSTAAGDRLEGTYDLKEFVADRDGAVQAIGTLSGTLSDATGAVIGTVTDMPVTMPLTSASSTCEILHLELGPLDLDVLGLMVHLDPIVLDISAQEGSGNLLGNLLCQVARLLDRDGPGRLLAHLLNRILSQL